MLGHFVAGQNVLEPSKPGRHSPKILRTPVKVVDTLKFLCALPLQSQVIQNTDSQKRCFLGSFGRKLLLRPISTIRIGKLWISAFKDFRQEIGSLKPPGRQNFSNALRHNCIHDLRLLCMKYPSTS